jgi:hypothetical protein
VKIRSGKLRSLAVLPVLTLGSLALAGCDSKAGTAAVVNGQRISEKNLSSYVSANAQPIQSSDGSSSVPAKNFVLQYLIRNQVLPMVLSAGGASVTDAQLDATKAGILQGSPEQALTDQITKLGLSARFEPVVMRNRELLTVLQAKLTTDKQITDALAKVKDAVSISPRYGSWDTASLSVVDLGKKELPSMLSFEGTLPGDVKLPAQQ